MLGIFSRILKFCAEHSIQWRHVSTSVHTNTPEFSGSRETSTYNWVLIGKERRYRSKIMADHDYNVGGSGKSRRAERESARRKTTAKAFEELATLLAQCGSGGDDAADDDGSSTDPSKRRRRYSTSEDATAEMSRIEVLHFTAALLKQYQNENAVLQNENDKLRRKLQGSGDDKSEVRSSRNDEMLPLCDDSHR